MKVLYLSCTAEIAGGEMSLLDLLDHRDRASIEPIVALPGPGPLQDELRRRSISFRHIRSLDPKVRFSWRQLCAVFALWWLIRREKVDLVHANSHTTMTAGVIASRSAGVPVIGHIRLILCPRTIRWRLLPWATRLICNSHAAAEALYSARIPKERITVVHNAVSAKAYTADPLRRKTWREKYGISDTDVLLGIVGRIYECKGHALLIEAMKKVVDRSGREVRLAIVGPFRGDRGEIQCESYWKELEGRIAELDLSRHVLFTGFQRDMASVYNGLDVLVMATPKDTRPESFGRALVEAMAASKPVIAGRSGGPQEIVADHETGLLVPPGDPEALARAILFMIEDEYRTRHMGMRGRQRVEERFSMETHIRRIAEVYSEITSARTGTVLFVMHAWGPEVVNTGGIYIRQRLYEFLKSHTIPVDQEHFIPHAVLDDLAIRYPLLKLLPRKLKTLVQILTLGVRLRKHRGVIIENHDTVRDLVVYNLIAKLAYRAKILVMLDHFNIYRSRDVKRPRWLCPGWWKERLSLLGVDYIGVLSHSVYEDVLSLGWDRARIRIVAPAPVITPALLSEKENVRKRPHEVRLLFTGQCKQRKGLIYLIRALGMLKSDACVLDVAGNMSLDAGCFAGVRREIDEMGIKERVRFHGYVPAAELAALYSQADIFVLPSLWEGFGIAVVEAMSFGLPVIASDIPCIRELVREDENGLLVSPGDPEDLAEKLSVLCGDPLLRRRMGDAGRTQVTGKYSWERSCQEYYSVIREMSGGACPVCSSGAHETIGRPYVDEHLSEIVTDSTTIRRCQPCGHFYVSPMPVLDRGLFDRMYNACYFPEYTPWWNHVRNVVNPNRRFDLLEKHTPAIKKYIEIGCGRGEAILQARKRGWTVFAQEKSGAYRSHLKYIEGITVLEDAIDDLGKDFFDAVYLDSVIEHIPDPDEFIKKVRTILKPKGAVYVVCPNADSLWRNCLDAVRRLKGNTVSLRIEPFTNPYHIQGFTSASLRTLLERNGFRTKELFVKHDYRTEQGKKYMHPKIDPSLRSRLCRSIEWLVCFLGEKMNRGENLEGVFVK